MSSVFALALLALVSCSDEPAAPPKPPPPPVAPAPPPPPPPAADAAKPADEVLVPSPAQVAAALKDAGITADVEKLVAKGTITVTAENKDEVAVRTGVQLAYLVLTAKTATKPATLARLEAAKAGFAAMGAGSDISKTIDELAERIRNDALNSDDLVVELDQLSRVLVPEVSYEAGPRCVPLIQAGSWLAGTNVVSGAIDASGKPEAATKLLKHPEVVKYFLKYTETEGQAVAPPMIMAKLKVSLEKLSEVANKDVVGAEDVKAVYVTTGEVLGLL